MTILGFLIPLALLMGLFGLATFFVGQEGAANAVFGEQCPGHLGSEKPTVLISAASFAACACTCAR